MKSLILYILLSLLAYSTIAAQLTASEVYLLEFQDNDNLKGVKLLSNFNPDAYNNQPHFLNENEVLLTAQLDGEQTDIVKLNLEANTWKRLTSTTESEYSPKSNSESSFTVVRVEQNEDQVLWVYPLSLIHKGENLLPDVANVGYYHYLPNFKIALFLIEKSMNLHVANLRNDKTSMVSQNIGRCFQTSKNGQLYFTMTTDGKKHLIKTYNSVNSAINSITTSIGKSQDFCLYGSSEKIIMASGSSLYYYDQKSSTWLLWIDLSEFDLNNISRIESFNNRILLVNER